MSNWLVSELRTLAAPSELARYALDMAGDRVTLIERTLNGPRARGEALHGSSDFDTTIAALRQRVARRRGRSAPVDILLPPELTLARIETFPAEARKQLREEAWWRLERLTPYEADELCYDVAIVYVEPKTGFLEVHIAVAPREIVDEALGFARDWGFSPQRVSASGLLEGFPHGPLFLEAANAAREARALKRVAAGLMAAATLVGCLGVGRAVLTRLDEAERLERAATVAETTLQAALIERARVLDLAARAERPSQRRAEQLAAADWVRALAEATPGDLRIDRLLAANGALRIEGASANAEAALAALDLSEAFETPRFAGPVRTLGGGAARQRFAIEASIAAPQTPETVEDTATGAATATATEGEGRR